jgi:SPOR domain
MTNQLPVFILVTVIFVCGVFESFAQKTQPVKEDLSAFTTTYTYEREFYTGEEITIKVPYETDFPLFSNYNVEPELIAILDYVAPSAKTYERVVSRKTEGWRIQIYRGRSREEAEKAKKKAYELLPRVTPYLTYSAPTYRVKVGDFLEPSEYITVYKVLKRQFSTALPVPDVVNIVIMGTEDKDKFDK